jgi:hypothetical protein
MHGVGWNGSTSLPVTCLSITSNTPCTVSFTPTADHLNVPGGVYTYGCTHTECAPTLAVHNAMTGTITIVP